MKASPDFSTILIENPLTGNGSFAAALRLKDVEGVPKWATPSEAREVTEGWRNAKKIVLVRDPVERFEAGATLTFSAAKGALDDFPDLRNLVQSTDPEETSAEQRGAAMLRFMKAGGEVPEYLLPQSRWLSAHFDIVLATHDIAEYFNVDGKVCCLRSGSIVNAPGAVRAKAAGETTRPLFLEVFAEDIALFKRLRLWSPNPENVRLLSGNCSECKAKNRRNPDGSPKELIDLTIDPEAGEEVASPETTEEETPAPFPTSGKRRTRHRPSPVKELDNTNEDS